MVRQCQVCGKISRLHPNLSFHRFPVDPVRRNIWFSLVGIDKDRRLPIHPEICSDHFDPTDIIMKQNGLCFVKRGADPKLIESSPSPQPSSSGTRSPPEDASDDEDFKIDIKQEFDHTAASTAVQSNSSNSASTLEDPNPPKRTKLEDHHCSSYDNTTVLHLLQEIREMINSRNNPISIFFDSMAKTVMQFPPAQAAEVKLKVCQIVTEMECKLLEESGNYPENLENFQ